MYRTAIIHVSLLLITLSAAICSAADRDRAYQRPVTTVLQQPSSSAVLPAIPTNSAQLAAKSNDRNSRNNRTMPSQVTQSVLSPPVADVNDLQAMEFPGVQSLTLVTPPSLFDLETADQEKSEELNEQQEEISETPQQEYVISSEPDQPEATEIGPVVAIGYYTSEPPIDQENEVVSKP